MRRAASLCWMVLAASLAPPAAGRKVFVIVAEGCSGSSWVGVEARKIMIDVFGLPMREVEDWELTKNEKNPFFEETQDIGSAVRRVVDADSSPILLKSLTTDYKKETLRDVFRELDARMAYVHRQNGLNREICAVKDCFASATRLMAQVDDSGAPRPCSSRRFAGRLGNNGTSSERVMVLNPATLADYLRGRLDLSRRRLHKLRSHGLVTDQGDLIAYEKLAAFEYDHDAVDESAAEWIRLMTAFGIANQTSTPDLRAYLASRAGALPKRPPNSHLVVNALDVKTALVATGDSALADMVEL